jgi:hypothetical protein
MSTANPQTKRRKSHRKSNATKLAHKKFRWFEQLAADPEMPVLALRACIVVGSKCSLDGGGVAIIGQSTIAGKLGVWRQAANQALRQAIALGHLEAIQRGRNKPNGYRMVLKDEASETASADVRNSRTTGRNESRTSSSNESRTSGVRKSRTDSPFFSPGALTEPPGKEERERRTLTRSIIPPAAGSPPLDAGPPRQEEAKEEKQASSFTTAAPDSRPESPAERSAVVLQQERFGELRAIWQRGWPADDAPEAVASAGQAFAQACREVAPEVIIEAATVWVAAFEAGDGVRFLPPLARWFAAKGWTKPPPTKAKRGANGHKAQRSTGYAKPDMFATVLLGEGYREDADGNLYWAGGGDDEQISTSMWGGGR